MSNYSSILRNFRKELKNTFQAQKNIVDVSQKYIGLLEEAEGGAGGGIDYSETEQDTGLKWVDGKTIYQKTINFGTLTNNKTVAHGISNLDNVINFFGVAKNPDTGDTIQLVYNESSDKVETVVSTTNVITYVAGNFSAFTWCYITIQYTKSA